MKEDQSLTRNPRNKDFIIFYIYVFFLVVCIRTQFVIIILLASTSVIDHINQTTMKFFIFLRVITLTVEIPKIMERDKASLVGKSRLYYLMESYFYYQNFQLGFLL